MKTIEGSLFERYISSTNYKCAADLYQNLAWTHKAEFDKLIQKYDCLPEFEEAYEEIDMDFRYRENV